MILNPKSGEGSSRRRGPSPTAIRQRAMPVAQQRVWEIVADPTRMAGWWPRVDRVEGVDGEHFTQVLISKRGRPVRMDFQVVAFEPPSRRAWSQEIEGTPFERVLSESITEVTLSTVAGGTRVVLAERQKLRGYSRTGGAIVNRATLRKLDAALEGLERLCSAASR